jgi:hypothetical protein
MLSWSTITYGASLSAVGAALLVTLADRPRRVAVLATAAASAFLGPMAWNAILRDTHARSFFHDAPIAIFPVSWQDTGSGVFALATAALLLGLGPLSGGSGRRLVAVALLSALSSLLVDVYLY